MVIQRLSATAGNADKEEYSVVDSFNCHIQPTSLEVTMMVDGKLFKTFDVWCPITANIREQDLLIPSGTIVYPGNYVVSGVQKWQMGRNSHIKAIIHQAVGS